MHNGNNLRRSVRDTSVHNRTLYSTIARSHIEYRNTNPSMYAEYKEESYEVQTDNSYRRYHHILITLLILLSFVFFLFHWSYSGVAWVWVF